MVSMAFLRYLDLRPSHAAIISPTIDINRLYNRYSNTKPMNTSKTTELNMGYKFEFVFSLISFGEDRKARVK